MILFFLGVISVLVASPGTGYARVKKTGWNAGPLSITAQAITDAKWAKKQKARDSDEAEKFINDDDDSEESDNYLGDVSGYSSIPATD